MEKFKAILFYLAFGTPFLGFGQNELENNEEILSKEVFTCEWDTLEIILP